MLQTGPGLLTLLFFPLVPSFYWVLHGSMYSFPVVRYSFLLLADVLQILLCLKVSFKVDIMVYYECIHDMVYHIMKVYIHSWCIYGQRWMYSTCPYSSTNLFLLSPHLEQFATVIWRQAFPLTLGLFILCPVDDDGCFVMTSTMMNPGSNGGNQPLIPVLFQRMGSFPLLVTEKSKWLSLISNHNFLSQFLVSKRVSLFCQFISLQFSGQKAKAFGNHLWVSKNIMRFMKESISQRYGNRLEFCSLNKMTTSIFNCVVGKTCSISVDITRLQPSWNINNHQ